MLPPEYQQCSPNEAQHNPGMSAALKAPDSTSLHPCYSV